MKRAGDALAQADVEALEDRIEAAEEKLAGVTEALEDERAAEIWRTVMAEEKTCGSAPSGRTAYLTYLGWAVGHSTLVGAQAFAEYACSCGDQGWVETADGSYLPCRLCNPKAFELWVGGHFATNHTCPTCAGKRKYRAAGDPRAATETAESRGTDPADEKAAAELEQAQLL